MGSKLYKLSCLCVERLVEGADDLLQLGLGLLADLALLLDGLLDLGVVGLQRGQEVSLPLEDLLDGDGVEETVDTSEDQGDHVGDGHGGVLLLLARGERLTELLKQKQYSPMAVSEMVPLIFAGVNGYLDAFPVNKIGAWEADFLAHLKSNHPDILSTIEKEGQLSKELEDRLREVIGNFNKSFSS